MKKVVDIHNIHRFICIHLCYLFGFFLGLSGRVDCFYSNDDATIDPNKYAVEEKSINIKEGQFTLVNSIVLC